MTCSCPTDSPVTFLSSSRGLCRECRRMVDVRYIAKNNGVYLEHICPVHGKHSALVAESLAWYLDAIKANPLSCPPSKALVPRHGRCPESCGPCAFHAQSCHLPVFSITNACNLSCPICFTYNRADTNYFMSEKEFAECIDFVIKEAGTLDLINITGGEPTLHPELISLLRHAKRPEIGRITVNSNGLELARNTALARELADLGVYVIMSLDTLDPAKSRIIHGQDIVAEKMAALEVLERFNIPTTLLMVLIRGLNEDELERFIDLTLTRNFVRSLTIQTMTYTGQGGGTFGPRAHLPVDGVERLFETASKGKIRQSFFMPLPTAHPLCYGVAYLMIKGQEMYSLTELLDKDSISNYLASGYLLEPSNDLEQALIHAINRVWSETGDTALLGAIKSMMKELYPSGAPISIHERQRRAEKQLKTIYIHAHMDEDTYDIGRAMRCPDQVPVDNRKLIGACNYNLFYRMRDERFWIEP